MLAEVRSLHSKRSVPFSYHFGIKEFLMNGVVSLLTLLDRDETVRLLLLLLDSDKVRMLDLNERPDSDPTLQT
ncbi:unnamed protein product [Pleuronectes platessa]|uniref:Uncharacterized protein n=1 Tax=Pleuronectes platessa TaxID=8262 RepID=A0A9N7VGQ2_PLEPL|nr:unnamed protein product [Pleuronectes platessa]